jgi:hypothetical protein
MIYNIAAYCNKYTMHTVLFPGVKRPGRGINHLPHLKPRLKKK